MAGYLGTKAVLLSTTAATVTGDADIGGDLTVDTNTLYVDSTNNNVGIGITPSSNAKFWVTNGASPQSRLIIGYGGGGTADNYMSAGSTQIFETNGSERMRIDSSGNLLVGTTTVNPGIGNTAIGVMVGGTILSASRSDNVPVFFNRNTSDGNIVQFAKDGTTVGSIGSRLGANIVITAPTATYFDGGIRPLTDDTEDIGVSSLRFDDIYATNGTIQTSDQNEKQQISSLTDAEITAAKAISKLFKTFKWNDSVAEKGDDARIHSGVIAQEVEQAMTDAGLNAGDYAFFISTTWWETQTDVPAVEAVDAVYETVTIPAVEEEVDEEGNVIVEAQPETTEQRLVSEAVEGKEAYTRTDTYDTAEEAPEGATERNRKGIRYPQLLSFIGAATEQRLASIESRLDALEAV